jgi:hypothetical protein
MKFKLTLLHKAALFLGVYSAGAIAFTPTLPVALHLAATVGFALVLFFVYSKLFKKKKSLPDTLITAFILFLLLHYGAENIDLLYPLIATFLAITAKFFIKIKGGPLLNPAVGSLLILVGLGTMIPSFDPPLVSWWGANYQGYLSLALMAIWILTELKAWKKYFVVGTFLILHALILWIRGENDLLLFSFTDATLYFLVAIMLIEPKTSPIKRMDQISYAAVAAIAYNLFLHFAIPFGGLLTIGVANLFNFGLKFRPEPKKTVIKI